MAHPMRYRLVHVTAVHRLTPHMMRVSLGGEDLRDFASIAPDQQVKLFFAKPGQEVPRIPSLNEDGDVGRWYQAYLAMPDEERPWMRAYSIRRHRPDDNEVDIDFVLHGDHGPASAWATRAAPGDIIGVLGPSVSHFRTPGGHDWRLIVGDETALPAIGALLESLPEGERVVVMPEVRGPEEEQEFTTRADVTLRWVHRGAPPGRSGALADTVRGAELPAGRVYAWVAGEAGAVRTIRRHLVNDRGVPKQRIAFTGYWRCDLSQDAPQTAEDVTDVTEMQADA